MLCAFLLGKGKRIICVWWIGDESRCGDKELKSVSRNISSFGICLSNYHYIIIYSYCTNSKCAKSCAKVFILSTSNSHTLVYPP